MDIFPRLHEAFHTWAFEYVNNMLVPIDNFISRATERFITGGAMVGDEATPYLAMVMSICRATLTTHAQNLPDQEQHGACKLLESLLHNCHGRIDAQVPEVLSLALMRLEALLAAEEGRRKDGSVHSMVTLLYNVLSSALHYNAALALHAPASMGATRATGNAVSATMFTGGKQSNPKQNFQKFNKGTIATGKKPAALKNSLKGVSTARSAQSFVDVTGNAYQEVDTFVPQYDEIGVLPPIGRWDPLQIREQGPEIGRASCRERV